MDLFRFQTQELQIVRISVGIIGICPESGETHDQVNRLIQILNTGGTNV